MPELHPKDGRPLIAFADAGEFERWLDDNSQDSTGFWMKIAKKASGIPSITYDETVDVALCFGWIDGQKGAYDSAWFLQRFTPRRPRSIWSKVNTQKVAALTAAGRMRPAGLAEVEKAQADGRWEAAYSGSRDTTVPADLQEFLDGHPDAAAFWASLNATNRYPFLFRLQTAKRAETRAKRFAEFTRMLQAGEKF
ncbi:MAG: YdeI/OmpD-associated family protein [Propionibacteriales bacterium]|nr:YdeI/OmpD-associated family protein [Propionibacteriales bacterium]